MLENLKNQVLNYKDNYKTTRNKKVVCVVKGDIFSIAFSMCEFDSSFITEKF